MTGTGIVLVTGATGYVGGRLVPRLLAAGYCVRLLVRDPARLQGRAWTSQVDVVRGDVLHPTTLPAALAGVEVAYYFIHSLRDTSRFQERDLTAAQNFGQAARRAGVQRIIYLGGLADPAATLSPHLQSRHQTGQALRAAGVPVTEFRAGVIVGSGSISFEMVRYLTERLPIMLCPRWVFTRIQPIAIRDVVDYLVAALGTPESVGQTIEIGGQDVLTYAGMLTDYAWVRGLRRLLVPVPVLTPRLSAAWVHWVTPIPAQIARPLIAGLRNEVVVRDNAVRRLFPAIVPMTYEAAVREALAQVAAGQLDTVWSDALASSLGDTPPVQLTTQAGLIVERRQQVVAARPAAVYAVVTSLGGQRGWRYADWAWRVRGLVDRLAGGSGLRRGRRHPNEVRVGDAVDFWRVEAVTPGRLLRLRAEMKLPGAAWLQFEVHPLTPRTTCLVQTACFAPKGLAGWLYWSLLYPIHRLIFSGLIRHLAAEARGQSQ